MLTIPDAAPPQSAGTKTLKINNNKGWDMWIKITNIVPKNGLQITSYEQLYQYLPNGGFTSFDIKWSWNVDPMYSGEKGGATVYFQTKCQKPNQDELFIETPNAPANFKITNKTDNSMSLIWDKTDNVEGYRLYLADSSDKNATLLYEGTNTTFVHQNLWSGTKYHYHLYAYNGDKTSNQSWVEGYTTGVSPIPTTPTNFVATDKADTTLTLKWNASAKATDYYLWCDNGLGGLSTGNITTYTLKNLTPGTNYYCDLTAMNSYVNSGQAILYASTTGQSPYPGKPLNFRMISSTDTSVTLGWDPVSNATSYHLWNYTNVTLPSSQTTFTVTGLQPGTSYNIYMEAINSYGKSSSTNTIATTTGSYPYPSKPTNFKIADKTNTTMKLTWDAVSGATSYTLKKGSTVIYTGTSTSFDVTGLTKDTSYTFNLYATNSNGNSNTASVSGTTTNVTYDDTSIIGTQCQAADYVKTFVIPTSAKPGDTGTFMLKISNSSAQIMTAKINSIDKTGGYFGGSKPIEINYDTAIRTVPSNSYVEIPINWNFPSGDAAEYSGQSGTIYVNFTIGCQ
jgi:fibronectin type 3 domain-containing protein